MATLGGFNCPFCRYYNARGEVRCARCERRLPPPSIAKLLVNVGGIDLWATKLLAGTSIFVFALEMVASGGVGVGLLGGMRRSVLLRFGALAPTLDHAEPWRLLAACFVHMGILHIAMNMFALAELGRAGEPLVKGPRFLIAYVVTGVVGFLTSALWYGVSPLTAGASGAIFGLDGILLGDRLARKDPAWRDMLVRTIVHSFIFYFALGGATNQAAHMGGLGSGIALGVFFARERRAWRFDRIVGPAAAACAIAIPASIVASYASPVWRALAFIERARDDAERTMAPEPRSDPFAPRDL